MVTEYAKLISEQLKLERQETLDNSENEIDPHIIADVLSQIEDLKNIISYENANIISSFSNFDRDVLKNSKYFFLGIS